MTSRDRGARAAPSFSRATAIMSSGTALSRVTGFVRVSVMAWAIGGTESRLPDTYNLANSMPNIVYQLVIGEVLSTLFVPVFIGSLRTRSREDAWQLVRTISTLAVGVVGVASAIAIAIAPALMRAYTGNVPADVRGEVITTGAFFLRIFMLQMIFYALSSVWTGLLNAHRRFGAPMFAPVLNNAIVIATFIAFRIRTGGGAIPLTGLTTADKVLLAGGTTLGVVAMALALLPSIWRLPDRVRGAKIDLHHPEIARVSRQSAYAFGYVITNQIGLWVVFLLAGRTQGGVSAYQYSFILYQLPYAIFAVSVMTYLVPRMAEHHVDGDHTAMREDVARGLRTTALVVLPAAAGFIALGRPLTRLFLQRGAFGAGSTGLFSETFILMALGLGAFAWFQMLVRAFTAMRDTRTPFLANVFAAAVNIATAFPLSAALGVKGLGLSHALSYLGGALAAGFVLRQRIGGIGGKALASTTARIATAALATGLAAWFVNERIGAPDAVAAQLGAVLASVLAGLVAFVVVARLLRLDTAEMFRGALRRTEAGATS